MDSAGQDLFGGLGPDERTAALVVAIDEGADGANELADALEGSAADGLTGDDREEDLYEVQPGARGWREVQRDPRVLGQPLVDVVVLVGVVVVEHDVQRAARVSARDLFEEVQELGFAVAVITAIDHAAGRDLQRGEQRGRAVALVVVRRALGHPGPQGQDRLRAVQRLDLGLLDYPNAVDNRAVGRGWGRGSSGGW